MKKRGTRVDETTLGTRANGKERDKGIRKKEGLGWKRNKRLKERGTRVEETTGWTRAKRKERDKG